MEISLFDFFSDPVLRAPTIGSMLMCLSSSLIGVVAFIRKRSLVGEALSHASYPGVVLSVLFTATFFPDSDEVLAIAVLVGAFLSALLGLFTIDWMQKRMRVPSDAALCFVLSGFFGAGIWIASALQFTHTLWYKQIQVFLYGQAATMTDVHIGIYSVLALITLAVLFICYRPIQAVSFDRDFSHASGIKVRFFDTLTFFLLVLSIVVGIRSVGVVLMSGMVIAPAVAARQWTHRLPMVFLLAGLFGVLSGFCGNFFSVKLPNVLLPTGPMILLSSAGICLLSLLFAPQVGLLSRFLRIARFRGRRLQENILKALWKKGKSGALSFQDIAAGQGGASLVAWAILWRLQGEGWVMKEQGAYLLTPDGWSRAVHIVRLHRLWEVYLVDYLGQQAHKVHQNAEEMEHILTPELEKELTELLSDPKHDPHQQPIPAKEKML